MYVVVLPLISKVCWYVFFVAETIPLAFDVVTIANDNLELLAVLPFLN